MSKRPTLPLDFTPGDGALFLQRAPVASRAGRLSVSPAMRARFAAALPAGAHSLESGLVTIGPRESVARGISVGLYRDLRGKVRHVQDERSEIRQDAETLRAADHGLVQLSESQRQFMERRIDLLERFDAAVAQRRGPRLESHSFHTI